MDSKMATKIAVQRTRKGPGNQEKPFVSEVQLINKEGL